MNVKVEEAGPCRKTLQVEIAADEVEAERRALVSAYAKKAKIPGFRPGKAPETVVERQYKKELEENLRDRLIGAGYQEALKQTKLEPVAAGEAQAPAVILRGQPYLVAIPIEVPPDFTLPDYRGIKLAGKKIEATDADVEQALEAIRDRAARYDEVKDRPIQQGDLVQIDYEGVCEGKPIEELAPKAAGLGKGKDFWVTADERSFLPGFGEKLVGAGLGEKREVAVDFPKDFQEPVLAGRKAAYFTDIKALREKKVPALDEDFLKVYQATSVEDLKTKVRNGIQEARKREEQDRLKQAIMKHLLEQTPMDVPSAVVSDETRQVIYDVVRQQTTLGIPREKIEENKDRIFEGASQTAGGRVKLRYILQRIARAEKIEASNEDMALHIRELAGHNQIPESKMLKELEERHMLEKLAADIRNGKTLDFLLDQASVTV